MQMGLALGLTLLASVSPLLTFAKLWQVKEWRTDRLREHLTREGWLHQLFGRIRPAILAAYAMVETLAPERGTWWILGALSLLALLALVQIALKRQKRPVWTQKARILVAGAFCVTVLAGLLILALSAWQVLPLLPLFQPLVLLLVWTAFLPVDRRMKRRILDQARAIRNRNPGLVVIGVTGSVGKTTTKELLAHVLGGLSPLVTPAHVNTEVGVAQWMTKELPRYAATTTGKKILIVEMGAYRPGEIALMSDYVQQTHGIVTYVGTQHLALFGSQERLRDAKAEMVTCLPPDGHAYLNADNPLCAGIRELSPCPVTLVGTGRADTAAEDVSETPTGIAFSQGGTRYTVPIHGTHNVVNVLFAIALGKDLGLDAKTIAGRLRTFAPPHKTFSVREEKGVRILDDTHNASAASLEAAIRWARTQPYDRRVLLTAGLIELGEAQERTERELGERAKDVFSRVIFTQPKAAGAFPLGYGKPVEALAKAECVPAGSLLVCVGRMPASAIDRLLPRA